MWAWLIILDRKSWDESKQKVTFEQIDPNQIKLTEAIKMESNLKSYQSEYGNLTAEITANLSKITQNIRTETIPEDAIGKSKKMHPDLENWKLEFISDTKTLIQRVDKNFEDASDLFEQMELEIRELPTEDRSRHLNSLESFKAELKRLDHEYTLTKRRVKRHQERLQLLNCDEQIDSSYIEVDVLHSSAKDRLIDNTETLERSSRKLDQGHNLLHETESVGASVLTDLQHQREVLSRARNRVRFLNSFNLTNFLREKSKFLKNSWYLASKFKTQLKFYKSLSDEKIRQFLLKLT